MSQRQRQRISGGVGADEEYWRGLGRGAFRLPHCKRCGKWIWPAHWRCGACGTWDPEWVDVAPEGSVYSWTRTWYAFDRIKERTDDIPYVVILAEIAAAAPVRVMGVMSGPEDKLKIGAPVRGIILPPSEKTKNYPSITWQLA